MGFVKLPDDLNEWAWYNDNAALLVCIRLRLEAKYKPADVGNVHLERGQTVTSIREISEKNNISIRQARTALERLETTHKIAIKSTAKNSVITLLDYDCADVSDTQNDTQNDTLTTSKRHAERQTSGTLTTQCRQTDDTASLLKTNSIKSEEQTSRKNACPRGGVGGEQALINGFERFWSAYPKKTAKQNALKVWVKLKPDDELIQHILSSLEQQKRSVQWTKDNGQYIPYPATWLNGRRWEDEPPLAAATPSNSGWTNEPLSEEAKQQMINGFFD